MWVLVGGTCTPPLPALPVLPLFKCSFLPLGLICVLCAVPIPIDVRAELLPYAALVHCAFGIWQHTYFKVEGSTIIGDQLSSLSNTITNSLTGSNGTSTTPYSGDSFVVDAVMTTAESLHSTAFVSRITQPNGIPLLVCLVLLVAWVLFRHVLWRLFRSCLRSALRPILRCNCCAPLLFPREPSPTTYEDALVSGALMGCPTYRLPHHPRYTATFSGRLHRAIWLRAQGPQRFTRVVRFGCASLMLGVLNWFGHACMACGLQEAVWGRGLHLGCTYCSCSFPFTCALEHAVDVTSRGVS